MITAKLEQMIHEGIASSRTFVCGMSGNCVLDVPEGKYIIIHNIVYFPFWDTPEGKDGSFDAQKIRRANKQVEFKSQKSDNHYIFRDSGLTVLNPINVDCYLVHFDNVAISFLVQPDVVKGNIIDQASPTTSVVRANPQGYGGLLSVLDIKLDVGAMQYQPANNKNSGQVPNATYRGEFKLDYTNATKLFNTQLTPDGDFLNRSLPILNVQYVLINKGASDKVQASS